MRFRKKIKNVAGKNIKIISNFKLDTEQISNIVDIVNYIITNGYYEPCFHISKRINDSIRNLEYVISYFTIRYNIVIKLKKQ